MFSRTCSRLRYDVSFALQGFRRSTTRVQVTVGAAVTADTKLELGAVTETVAVTATAAVVNVSNAEVSTTVTQEQIRELPTLTRNPYDLVALAGNVTERPPDTPITSRRGTGFSLNGLRASGTNILLDGAANNNEFDTTVGQDVPLDSVQEFSVVTNNFSAQYGRATGGIVNVVTKSGTNEFHGTGTISSGTTRSPVTQSTTSPTGFPRACSSGTRPGTAWAARS